MTIWWLFSGYLMFYMMFCYYWVIWWNNRQGVQLTQFPTRQSTLPQNTCGQACTSSEGNLQFAWLITAKRSQCTSMLAMTFIRMQGCKPNITAFAFEIQESLGLLALHLTRLTVHRQPQPVQRASLSKLILWFFDDYLMMFWWCFDNVLSCLINICKIMHSEWLTQFRIRQAMLCTLPQNTCGQACTTSEGNLWFAWFISANQCKASPAHFDAHDASNRRERADRSVGGNIRRAAQQREQHESVETPSTGPNAFSDEELDHRIGASRLSSSSAPEARAGRRLRRAREDGEAAAGDRRASFRRELC